MIFHRKDDGTKLVHFALNNKYWCPKCKLFRTRVEVAFVKGEKYEQEKNESVRLVSNSAAEPIQTVSTLRE